MQFSDLFKSSSRISYVPRQGYGKFHPPANVPKLDNLFLSDACGFSLPFDSSISMEQYLIAVGDIVGDQKMVFAGKSNDSIKIYLTSEAEVSKFFENNPQVVINNKPLTVRKLINNGHKIYLCNTKPGIPDSLIIDEISKFTKIMSPMKFVTLGIRNARFSHLISFKRMVMVEEIIDLPASINVFFEDYVHKIFITIDKAKCFRCQSDGHLVKNCTVLPPPSVQDRFAQSDTAHSTILNKAPPLNSDRVNTTQMFVPAFASRTSVGAPTPLNEKEVASTSTVTPTTESSPPEVTSVSVDVHTLPTSKTDDKLDEPSQEVQNVVENSCKPTLTTDVDMNTSDSEVELFVSPRLPVGKTVGIKRGSSSSPDKSSSDKKVCVAVDPHDLKVLIPLITKTEPSLNPETFINLIEDLKNQAADKKVNIIKSNYNMDPLTVAKLFENLVLDNATVLHNKVKLRLRNLHKSITNVLMMKEDESLSPLPLSNL